jgi:hypothetical protein
LFHGTSAALEILKQGFDDHFWNAGGYFGRGAYFADDPNLSTGFAAPGAHNLRSIFVVERLKPRQKLKCDDTYAPIVTFFPIFILS